MKIQYSEDGKNAQYNGYSFRKDPRTGYFLSSKDIEGKRRRLHVYVWETETGKNVPEGYHVHHIESNKNHNDISNLKLLEAREHEIWHGKHMTEERRRRAVENVICKAMPEAKEWHRSAEGHEWHKQHYEAMGEKLHEMITHKCKQCGKVFIGPKNAVFCSNNCKSAWRRNSRVDDIEKTCVICGGKYLANKYSNTKYCPVCRDKKHNSSRKRAGLQHAG